jgi:hypothetical protein
MSSRNNSSGGRNAGGRGRGYGRGRGRFGHQNSGGAVANDRGSSSNSKFRPHHSDKRALFYVEGRTTPNDVESTLEDWKTHCIENYFPGLDRIFDVEGGDYPDMEEPEKPDDPDDFFERESWKEDQKAYKADKRTFEKDVVRLIGFMLGQMSPESKERVRQDEDGATAIDEKDPLALVQAIRRTHYTPASSKGAQRNLYYAVRRWNSLKMGESESVEQYKRRATSELEAVRQAALAAEEADGVPSDTQATLHFVLCMSQQYSEFKVEFERQRIVPIPTSLQEALDAALKFGKDKSRSSYTLYSGKTKAGAGSNKGREKSEDGGDGSKDPCRICNKRGHWWRDCEVFLKAAKELNQKPSSEEAEVIKAVGELKLKAGGGSAGGK